MKAVNGDTPAVVSTHISCVDVVQVVYQILIYQKSESKSTAQGTSTVEPGTTSRIRFRDRKYNKQGYAEETDGTPTIKEGRERQETTAHAMTVLRAFKNDGKYNYSEITINDDGLTALLLHALGHEPWLRHMKSLSFLSLFEPIVHNWSMLDDLANNNTSNPIVLDLHRELENKSNASAATSGDQLAPLKAAGSLEKARADLRLLLDEVCRTPGLELYFNSAREMQEKTSTISFEYLWTIFPPGELVVGKPFMDRWQAFTVKYCSESYKKKRNTGEKWILECWTYDWNGTFFRRVPVVFSFDEFKATKSITSLPCYPLKFHPDKSDSVGGQGSGEALKQDLIKRGERYRELCLKRKGRQIFDYEGELLARGTGVRNIAARLVSSERHLRAPLS